MPFKKEKYNSTTVYYKAKKPQKISIELDKFVQYSSPFKQ
jgi:hypothetical protein